MDTTAEVAPVVVEVDEEAIRERAYELSVEHPDASAEENWLRSESELLTVIEMAVFGHP